jgi:hypothetical protein
LKTKIRWKQAGIPFNRLIQRFGRRPIKFGQVGVDDDSLAPNQEDSRLDLLHEDQRLLLRTAHLRFSLASRFSLSRTTAALFLRNRPPRPNLPTDGRPLPRDREDSTAAVVVAQSQEIEFTEREEIVFNEPRLADLNFSVAVKEFVAAAVQHLYLQESARPGSVQLAQNRGGLLGQLRRSDGVSERLEGFNVSCDTSQNLIERVNPCARLYQTPAAAQRQLGVHEAGAKPHRAKENAAPARGAADAASKGTR